MLFPPYVTVDIFCPAKLCSISRSRASSNARDSRHMSLHRCIALLLTFTPPFPITNSGGRQKGMEIKRKAIQEHF